MNLQQLQYFKCVADTGNMTTASKILYISQPALSIAVSNLEKEFGVRLFERKGHGVYLTMYGKILLNHVNTAIQELESSKEEISRLNFATMNTLRISSTYSLGSSFIPTIVRDFTHVHPKAVVCLKQGPNMDIIKNLYQKETDFVFGRIIPEKPYDKAIECLSLCSEELVVLVHKKNPLANKKELTLEDLKNETFVFFHESTGYRHLVMDLFSNVNYTPNITYEVYDNASCAGLVAKNLGIAIIGADAIYDKKTTKTIKFKSGLYKTNIFLLWNKELAKQAVPLYDTFLTYVRNKYRLSGHSKT